MLTLEQVIDLALSAPTVREAIRAEMLTDSVPPEKCTDEAIMAMATDFARFIREEPRAEEAITAFANVLFEAGRRAPRWVAAS